MSNSNLRQIFDMIEKYARGVLENVPESTLSQEENKVLALQSLNRLNQRIGMQARMVRRDDPASEQLRMLQTQVNSITVALKYDNKQLLRSSLRSARDLVSSIEK